jgi:transposase
VRPLPVELRTRIVAAVDRGVGSGPRVAALFGVSVTCVTNYLRLRERTGSLAPRPDGGGRPPAVGPERHDELRRLIAAEPDLTLDQIRDRLGLGCSLAAISRALTKLGLPRKKKRAWRPSSSGPTSKSSGRGGRSGRRR